jgi:dTDP-glucose 4,6-dehydratase
LDNFSTGNRRNIEHLIDDPGFNLVHADVCAPLKIAGPVDYVLHLASPASPRDYERMPVETLTAGSQGTVNALDLAERKRARFVFASTSEVYGDPRVHPQTESYHGDVNPIGPRSMYDEGKRFGEAIVTAYRLKKTVNTAIVRIFNTYGPRMRADDGRVVPTLVSQALAGKPLTIFGDGYQTRALCHVSDTVEGVVRLLRSEYAGPINLGNPEEVTIRNLADLVREIAGATAPALFEPPVPEDPQRRCPDISLASQLLGWHPQISLMRGLTQTISWFACMPAQQDLAEIGFRPRPVQHRIVGAGCPAAPNRFHRQGPTSGRS